VLDVVMCPTSRAACAATAGRRIEQYRPSGIDERYGAAWWEERIGAYSDAPATAPIPDP